MSLDSEDATGEAECDPVGGGQGEQSCCAGGNAPGGCICSSNVARLTLVGETDAQTILGRTAPFPQTTLYQVRGREARLHHSSKTVSPGIISTEAGSSEMFEGYSSWVRTSSSLVSVPTITPVASPTWSGGQSETTAKRTERPSEWIPTSQSEPSSTSTILSTETPLTTTISIIASTLTHSSASSSSPSNIPPSVPTVIPIFPDGESSEASSSEATTSSLATKLGLGLGIPLVVLAVALLTALIYRRQRHLRYAQAPPFDFNAPEMAPVSAADFAPPAVAAAQQQNYRRGPPQRANSPWSEWGTGVSAGAWTGTRAAAWHAGRGSYYDDYQAGFVDSSPGHQEGGFYYYNGARDTRVLSSSPPAWQRYEDIGSPYEDRGSHSTYQVPVVQVHQPPPQWAPISPTLQVPGRDAAHDDRGQGQGQGQGRGVEHEQPQLPHPQRDLARVSRGGLSVNEEVSPLSSTGSGMPYPRMSAISGMGGWETNPRVSRG